MESDNINKATQELENRLAQKKTVMRFYNDSNLSLDEAREGGIAPWTNVVKADFHVAVFRDAYAVTAGHLLFVPQYDTDALIEQCFRDALAEGRRMVKDGECEAFNIGLNMGRPAGQTVLWPHVHLIPRRTGDTPDPIGGVRNVIPFAGNYKRKVGWLKKILRQVVL